MILNTGSRTDIPAFYSEWFYNRIKEGYVLARNPYYPKLVSRYEIDPSVVDAIVFCTKNPSPMLEEIELLKPFRTVWYVTLTPYAKDIEPNVPDKHEVIRAVQKLSEAAGSDHVIWRYDPVFLNERYDMRYHLRAFETISSELKGYTKKVVISFLDLYEKTKKNFPEGREVSFSDQVYLTKEFVRLASLAGMKVYTCLENKALADFGADTSGCMSKKVLEECLHETLNIPHLSQAREGCDCLLGNDIGAYNTCMHFCRYCYANYDQRTVLANWQKHDPESPLLIGHLEKDDEVRHTKQLSYLSGQLSLDL